MLEQVVYTKSYLFQNKHKSPKDAEAFYGNRLQRVHSSLCGVSIDVQTEDMEALALLHMFSKLPEDMHLQTLSRLFSSYLSATSSVSVSEDFLCLAAAAMINLHNGGRSNVVYNLAKGIGTQRQDKSETRFPIKQMPMGLIEYVTEFFAVDDL